MTNAVHGVSVTCVTVSFYPATWAATRRLRRIYVCFYHGCRPDITTLVDWA